MDHWLSTAQQESIAQHESNDRLSLADALSFPTYRNSIANDAFASNIAIAYFTHSARGTGDAPPPELAQSIEQTPRCLFSFHAALLAVHAPIFELLAVSGESFVLGQKLPTHHSFQEATQVLQSWISDGSSAVALQHALQILRISMTMQRGRCGLIHEDWSLTMAALVCWACAIWPAQREVQASLLREHQESPSAMREMNRLSWAGGNTNIDWRGARDCLAWVKDRIQGRMGWLNQDAAGTLKKLHNGRVIDLDS